MTTTLAPNTTTHRATKTEEAGYMAEEDVVLHEEEKMLEKEEQIERQMLTVALVSSVVEGHKHRYSLRKRKRPSEDSDSKASHSEEVAEAHADQPDGSRSDLKPAAIIKEEGDTCQEPCSTKQDEDNPSYQAAPLQSGQDVVSGVRNGGTAQQDANDMPGGGQPQHKAVPIISAGSERDVRVDSGVPPERHQIPVKIEACPVQIRSAPQATQAPGTIQATHPAQQSLRKHAVPVPVASHQPIANVHKAQPACQTGKARKTDKPKTSKQHARLAARHAPKPIHAAPPPVPSTISLSVPNPLQPQQASSILLPQKIQPTAGKPKATSFPTNVPCPLPASTFEGKPPAVLPPPPPQAPPPEPVEKKRVTITEPIIPKRGRIFSMDIDPAGLEFPDMAVSIPADPVKVEQSTDLPLVAGGRDRAYSFEFFFNVDEPLPPSTLPPQLEEAMDEEFPRLSRPRGDSIIYDPVSFQDGGIHEENALLQVRAAAVASSESEGVDLKRGPSEAPHTAVTADPTKSTSTASTTYPTTVAPQVTTVGVTPASLISSATKPAEMNAGGQMATLPSSLGGSSVAPATFQMELLNKDGRIGIYLPDARKARIARFHAKRKMRIWRKRIKYDCRKKLADSRPRIKGRFVKRSDMEED